MEGRMLPKSTKGKKSISQACRCLACATTVGCAGPSAANVPARPARLMSVPHGRWRIRTVRPRSDRLNMRSRRNNYRV